MKVVIDTNILISAAIRDRIPEKSILWIINQPDVHWIASNEILEEYLQVIKRPKFNLTEEQILKWTNLLYKTVIIINPKNKIEFVRDTLDSKFIECGLFCNSDFIITGDSDFVEVEKLFNLKIISIKDFYYGFVQ